jgi:hypothetical protein
MTNTHKKHKKIKEIGYVGRFWGAINFCFLALVSFPIWTICMGLSAPLIFLESYLSWFLRANKNPWSGFWLAWLAFGRAILKKKKGLCYAGVADVFESLGMANNERYRRFAIGANDANDFYCFSQREPWNLFALFGLKRRSCYYDKYLSPGTVIIYQPTHSQVHGYSDKHGHIEIVISGIFRLAASDHIALMLPPRTMVLLEKKEGIAILESYRLGMGSGGIVPLISVFDFRINGVIRRSYKQLQANWIEKKYAALQMLGRMGRLGLNKARAPILEGAQLEEYLQARGYETAPKGIRLVSRCGWKACEPTDIPEYLGQISRLIVHHSARPYLSTQDDILEVRRIQERHIARGMTDIGYHFLIAPDGMVYEGRYGHKWTRGEHAARFNDDSIGVCVLGNYNTSEKPSGKPESVAKPWRFLENDKPLKRQTNSITRKTPSFQTLTSLCAWLCFEAGLAPDEKRPISSTTKDLQSTYKNTILPVIVGHKEVDSLLDLPGETTCPGDQLAALVHKIGSHQ